MSILFDLYKSITQKTHVDIDENTFVNGYNKFLIARALSGYPDNIFILNAVNNNIDPEFHYIFLRNMIERGFRKWYKYNKKENRELDIICEHFNCSYNVGRQYMSILNKKGVDILSFENN